MRSSALSPGSAKRGARLRELASSEVPPAAAAARRDHRPRADAGQIRDEPVRVEDHRPVGNRQDQILAAGPVAPRRAPRRARHRSLVWVLRQPGQIVDAGSDLEDHRPAVAAAAPVGPATGLVRLGMHRHGAVPTAPGRDVQRAFVDESHGHRVGGRGPPARGRWCHAVPDDRVDGGTRARPRRRRGHADARRAHAAVRTDRGIRRADDRAGRGHEGQTGGGLPGAPRPQLRGNVKRATAFYLSKPPPLAPAEPVPGGAPTDAALRQPRVEAALQAQAAPGQRGVSASASTELGPTAKEWMLEIRAAVAAARSARGELGRDRLDDGDLAPARLAEVHRAGAEWRTACRRRLCPHPHRDGSWYHAAAR